jgi:hypothetical protein
MFIFISVTATMMWAAFWGVIRLERSMGQAPRPDQDTAARAPALRHGSLRTRPPSGRHPGMCRSARQAPQATAPRTGRRCVHKARTPLTPHGRQMYWSSQSTPRASSFPSCPRSRSPRHDNHKDAAASRQPPGGQGDGGLGRQNTRTAAYSQTDLNGASSWESLSLSWSLSCCWRC